MPGCKVGCEDHDWQVASQKRINEFTDKMVILCLKCGQTEKGTCKSNIFTPKTIIPGRSA